MGLNHSHGWNIAHLPPAEMTSAGTSYWAEQLQISRISSLNKALLHAYLFYEYQLHQKSAKGK